MFYILSQLTTFYNSFVFIFTAGGGCYGIWDLGFEGLNFFGIWDLGGKIIWDLGFGENIWDLGFEIAKF